MELWYGIRRFFVIRSWLTFSNLKCVAFIFHLFIGFIYKKTVTAVPSLRALYCLTHFFLFLSAYNFFHSHFVHASNEEHGTTYIFCCFPLQCVHST